MKRGARLMGSANDQPKMAAAAETLGSFGVEAAEHVMSAHRTPAKVAAFASGARDAGYGAIICAAGMAAHLAGAVAAQTTLPVLGVPMAVEPFKGLDALLSTVQMPPGIPVGALAAGEYGATNAGLLAAQIVATADPALRERIKTDRESMRAKVLEKNAKMRSELGLPPEAAS